MQYWEYDASRGWVVLERTRSDRLCPRCGDPLYRVPRRLIDRLFSFRQHRFQCLLQACAWVGNLPIEGAPAVA